MSPALGPPPPRPPQAGSRRREVESPLGPVHVVPRRQKPVVPVVPPAVGRGPQVGPVPTHAQGQGARQGARPDAHAGDEVGRRGPAQGAAQEEARRGAQVEVTHPWDPDTGCLDGRQLRRSWRGNTSGGATWTTMATTTGSGSQVGGGRGGTRSNKTGTPATENPNSCKWRRRGGVARGSTRATSTPKGAGT